MTREVQSIILLLVGIATLRISWGTAYLNYVKEATRLTKSARESLSVPHVGMPA